MTGLASSALALKRLAAVSAAAFGALLLVMAMAMAQSLTFPPLSGRVVDAANILSPAAIQNLDAKLAALETKTSDQLVVATVPSLQGTSIDDFANQLFRNWQLGQKKTNNGVLVLVAPNERKVRIEVGYGLEGQLTDAISRMIILAAVSPKFKQGDYAAGLDGAVDAIVTTLEGGTEWQDRVKNRNQPADENYDLFTILLIFFIIFIVINIMASRSQQSGRRTGGTAHRRADGGWVIIPSSGGGWGGGTGGFSGGFGGGGGGFSGGGGSSGGGGASGDW